MLGTATRVLRLAFGDPPDAEVEQMDSERLDFSAYATDCQLSGTLFLDAARLTDLLNATDEIELLDVLCLTFDGRLVQSERAVVRRSELVAASRPVTQEVAWRAGIGSGRRPSPSPVAPT